MTREHKLAVVLGFGLLLFVGILVSDHFSAAHRRSPADLAARTPVRDIRANDPVSIQPLQVVNRPNMMAPIGPVVSPLTPQGDGVAIPQQFTGHSPQAVTPGIPAELYTLKDGETLYKICQTRYGNGNLWKELAEFNKGTVANPTKLRKGMTIRLPSASVLRGEEPVVVQAQQVVMQTPAGIPENQGMNAGNTEPAPLQREYIVQKGDTLGAIAMRELGTSKKWNEIFEANRDRLKSPTDLKIGKPLRIPTSE